MIRGTAIHETHTTHSKGYLPGWYIFKWLELQIIIIIIAILYPNASTNSNTVNCPVFTPRGRKQNILDNVNIQMLILLSICVGCDVSAYNSRCTPVPVTDTKFQVKGCGASVCSYSGRIFNTSQKMLIIMLGQGTLTPSDIYINT